MSHKMTHKMTHTNESANAPGALAPTRRGAAHTGLSGAAQCRIETPLGPMTALATGAGLAGLWFDAQAHHPGPLQAPVDPHHPHLRATQRWLADYWAAPVGAPTPPPTLPALDLRGTPFQRAVWAALLQIPPGATSTYAAIATAAGSPAAVRAAGAAIGRNPISLIVPCHRVLGSGGALTGYAGGLDRKRALLSHEGCAAG
jgi:methylated-DNA-[protein]-cysteine S-methyltransferase